MTRSLTASQTGIQLAKQALISKGWSQKNLIGFVCESRQPISKFFNGKSVSYNIFVGICEKLGLDWQNIADLPKSDLKINVDVQAVRDKVRADIENRCGTMQVLDMTQSIGLGDIYTTVNILETITGRRRLGIDELLQTCTPEMLDRIGFGGITGKRIPGMEAVSEYPKLMVWGKPGAGKTTLLKYLAIRCIGSQFQQEKVPIFITIKNFAETSNQPDLLEFINQQLAKCKVAKKESVELCEQGKALILLDGLDEVIKEDSSRAINHIQQFSDQYRLNSIVITCRIAAREYTFQGLNEVEVADFDDKQIQTFAEKWFQRKYPVKAEQFIKNLKDNKPIQELATSPLLLILLCLVFEETANFPSSRWELYKEGIDILLKKWDAKRNIERDVVYKKLSVICKEDLLSQVAWKTFKRGDYLFKQKQVEEYIADYIRNLPDPETDPEALQLDREAVLKSIEAQHGLLVDRAKGIYSFSHLTFQEYFTARKIVSDPQERVLQDLVNQITEKRWREVFLLVVGMLPSPDRLLQLMKYQVDKLVATDEKLQQFLGWVQEKSNSVVGNYKPAAIRAFYFSLDLDLNLNLDFNFNLACALELDLDCALELNYDLALNYVLDLALNLNSDLDRALSLDISPKLDHALNLNSELELNPKLEKALQQLRDKLPERKFNKWWQANGKAWTKDLREVIIKNRNIGHDRKFSQKQKDLLNQYRDANKLLVDCLNSDCYVSREVRKEIEDTLLLPIAHIPQNQQKA